MLINLFKPKSMLLLPELKQMTEDAYLFSKSNLLVLLDATHERNEQAVRQVELTEAVVLAEIDTLSAVGMLDSADEAGMEGKLARP
jgi:hypothetical protein